MGLRPEAANRRQVGGAGEAARAKLGGREDAPQDEEADPVRPGEGAVRERIADEYGFLGPDTVCVEQRADLGVLAVARLEAGGGVKVPGEVVALDVVSNDIERRATAEERLDTAPPEERECRDDFGEYGAPQGLVVLGGLESCGDAGVGGVTGEDAFQLAGEVQVRVSRY